jgi:hypothetical protein
MHEENPNTKVVANMSILLETPMKKKGPITKSMHAEPKTSSILFVSAAIVMAVVLVMYVGILYTEGTMKGNSECRNKIVGVEQKGMYSGPEQFKLALSYCEGK